MTEDIRLSASLDAQPLRGNLTYVDEDHAFSFLAASERQLSERRGNAGSTSLLVGTLQIELGVETRELLYVWGYHPRETWIESGASPGSIRGGRLHLADASELKPGVSISVARGGGGEWTTTLDPRSGWIRVARDPTVDDLVVEFARGIAIGMQRSLMHSIWLRPVPSSR